MKFKINIPQDIGLIYNVFSQHNHSLFLVGGCVRDSLLGDYIKDYDLVTDALPDRVIELLKNQHFVKNILETGKAFGIVNVITIDNNEYEIATFRSESNYTDSRRPDNIEFCDMKTDCLRRDLTFNSLYYDIEKEEIIDLVGGIEDLNNKVIRTVGKAEDRIKEDGLRSMRILRFAARFSSLIDFETDRALIINPNLDKISNERIRDEFIKGIKSAKSIIYFLKLIQKYEIFQYIFKDLKINEQFIEEWDYIVVIAYMLRENKYGDLKSKLNKLTYTINEIEQIRFLNKLFILDINNAYFLKKQQNNCLITKQQILKFGKLINFDETLLNAFVDFNLTITGEYVMNNYQLSEGKEVGIMIESLENQLFEKLLEKKTYEKGLF